MKKFFFIGVFWVLGLLELGDFCPPSLLNASTRNSLSSFELAFNIIKANEGGYVNHPSDYGGQTFMGITMRFDPDWPGWSYLHTESDTIFHLAKEYYYKRWCDLGLSSISNTTVAVVLFDTYIHHGKRAQIIIQKTCEDVGIDFSWFKEQPSPYIDTQRFISCLLHNRRVEYLRIVSNNKSQKVFLRGWFNRVNSLSDFAGV